MLDKLQEALLLISVPIGSIFSFMFGTITPVFYVLLALIVIDFATGVMKAIYTEEVSSKICSKGIIKKVFELIIVSIAHLVDVAIPMSNGLCMNIAMVFYLCSEAISILENAVSMGVAVPDFLMNILKQKHKDSNNGIDETK